MKISYNWLKEYLLLENSPLDLANILTDIGLEVDSIKEVESVKGGLKGVVIGHIISKKQHPNADRLNLTVVDIGLDSPLQIVCGAPNVDVGQKVPVATVGTWLYNGDDKFKIKKSKIRGEESFGMICGEDELGLGDITDGIMILDQDAQVGLPASEYFNIETDIVFEIGLTPNRSDAMGHIPVARDLMTVLNNQGANLQLCRPDLEKFPTSLNNKTINVEVRDNNLCPRYSGISISGVKVKESPMWLKKRLISIGLVPINNVVDITNFVLHETGQPLHAFDLDKIEGNQIIVSTLKNNTNFIALDGIQRTISSKDLMICDAKKPLCIAGVFGGIDSAVNKETLNIFLESAFFDPVSIRKTAKRHNLSTDASFRFERGCDPNMTIYALKRAAILIVELCEGVISSSLIDIFPNIIKHAPISLSYAKMDSLLGIKIDRDTVLKILDDLEIDVVSSNSKGLELLVPPFRADVTREVDIIEEILRIYGFNNVPIPKQIHNSLINKKGVNSEKEYNAISEFLSSNGFFEVMNNSLTSSKYDDLISEIKPKANVCIVNSLSNKLDILRQTLLFGGLENISYNQNRKNNNLKIYEFGKTYHLYDKKNIEKRHLQILVTGLVNNKSWRSSKKNIDFYYLKEKVQNILHLLGLTNYNSIDDKGRGMSYYTKYSYNGENLVYFGRVKDKICNKFNVDSEVFLADFNWDLMLKLSKDNKVRYQPVNKFPEVKRDLSLLIDEQTTFNELKKIALNIDNSILKSIDLLDVYEGEKLPNNKKSYTLTFNIADNKKTLKDSTIDKLMKKIILAYQDHFNAVIR